jgi:hypothetical protein
MAEVAQEHSSLVLGRYRPLRPLGSGGSGSVWLARDARTGRAVALKTVARTGTAGARAEREAAAAAQLDHPNCLRAYALARDAQHVYIVYEYVPGHTFREALTADLLDDEDALEAAAQILDGLAHAHVRGIVHRDVKPANVLLADAEDISVRLLDFGLALVTEEETLTAVGDVPGTLAYISPERLRGKQAGPPADIWSVGVLLWEALAGRHPFGSGKFLELAKRIERGAPSLANARPDLPRAVVRLVDSALTVDARKRPSARKLAASLRSAQTGYDSATPAVHTAVTRHAAAGGHAAAAALYVGWTSSTFSFFPAYWPLGLAATAALASVLSARVGLAFALAVPVLPLGNLSSGLAIVYAIAALAWLVSFWTRPRGGLMLLGGPLLAPLGLTALLPALALVAGGAARRALAVAGAVFAAAVVAGTQPLDVAELERPSVVASALWSAISAERPLVLFAVVLAAAAVALPYARRRGPWGGAIFGAAFLAPALLVAPGSPWPIVGAAWLLASALSLEEPSKALHVRLPARSRWGGLRPASSLTGTAVGFRRPVVKR